MGKRIARGAIWLVNGIMSVVMIITILLLLGFGVYAIWDTDTVIAAASSTQYEVYKPNTDTEEGEKTFHELQAINSDVIGWLTVYGTNIDYPTVQAENNDTYLTTSAEGEYSLSGAIFLDYRNDSSFKDFNSIIYGHHMDQDAMFGDVSDFKDREFFETHRYGNLYYDGKDHGIEFFAFIEADAYNSTMYRPGLKDAQEQEQYLADIQRDAMLTRDTDVKAGDRIVLLSTCTSDMTNGRHLLVGKITDEVYKDAFAEAVAEQQPVRKQVQSVDESKASLAPLWLLIIIVALMMILAIVMIYRSRHSKGKHAGDMRSKGDIGDEQN